MKFPLMKNNILQADLQKVINFLKGKTPILTQSKKVELFEKEWSKWLGVKYSIFVNSGSSANFLTMTLLKNKFPEGGEVIVPPLTWVSDIVSVLANGFKPRFVDINLHNLSMNSKKISEAINKKTRAVFITHAQGFNGLDSFLLNEIKKKKIYLIEDVCESHGASFQRKKLGSYGLISNFSFYYAHHLSTIEGGMICTNDREIYEKIRMLRSHGLIREMKNKSLINKYIKKFPHLNPEFIFSMQGFNFRNNEIGAIIGLNQLKRLDNNIKKRNSNFKYFLNKINQNNFYTDFDLKGSSNYAFNLIMRNKDKTYVKKLMKRLKDNNIEFRRGSAGGGNQLRQPYLSKYIDKNQYKKYPITDHVHFYGFYLGNYPDLKKNEIDFICKIINDV